VDPTNGKVTVAANSPSGTFRIRLFGETATTHQYYWIYYDIIGTVKSILEWTSPLIDVIVPACGSSYTYPIPQIYDDTDPLKAP
jgi:hypothetical protein